MRAGSRAPAWREPRGGSCREGPRARVWRGTIQRMGPHLSLRVALAAASAATLARADVPRIWQAEGPVAGGRFGSELLDLGDHDGDGWSEVLVADAGEPAGGAVLVGAAYVLSGRTGEVLRRLTGNGGDQEQFGSSVVRLGDLDGDGRAEVAIGARGYQGLPPYQTGAVYVFRGGSFALAWRIVGAAIGDSLGAALGVIDDVDGDGLPDLVNGVPGARIGSDPGAGRVDAISLATGARLWSRANPWQGPSLVQHQFGFALTTTADADADGAREVWVGSPGVFRSIPSASFVQTGALFRLSGRDGTVRTQVLVDRRQALGYDVDAAGDFDGDGLEDVACGGLGTGQTGAAYVFDRHGATLLEALGALDGQGLSVAAAGDHDGDGRADVAFADVRLGFTIGAPTVTVWSGRTLQPLAVLGAPAELNSLRFGQGLAPVADLGGDGRDDLLVADPFALGRGVLVALGDALEGDSFCAAVPNATGTAGGLSIEGRAAVVAGDATLTAFDLPPGAVTVFLASRLAGSWPLPGGSLGVLCLGGGVGRYLGPGDVRPADAAGRVELRVVPSATPTPTGPTAILGGETWYFQAWHRDLAPLGAWSSNFTRALRVPFH